MCFYIHLKMYVCMLSHFSHVDSLPPLIVDRQAPLSVGFSKQECWSGFPCPPPGDLPNPGIKSRSLTLHVDSLRSEPPEKPTSHLRSIWKAKHGTCTSQVLFQHTSEYNEVGMG